MKFEEFADLIANVPSPVILTEGRRSIPEKEAAMATRLSTLLAKRFPHLVFRSGNASGADQAFATGVMEVAPGRMEIIAPYENHRKKQRNPLAAYTSPESLSPEELAIIQAMTIAATPANKRLMKWYERGGKLGSQAACLIRDTMKVAGMKDSHAVPIAALFYVDPKEPEAGGTGHTIRVCRNANIPVIFQDHWTKWLMELNDF